MSTVTGRPPDLDRHGQEASAAGAARVHGSRRPGRWAAAAAVVAGIAVAGVAWVASRGPSDPDRLWAEAQAAFRAGRWAEARATLRRVERLRAKTAVDWVLQAQLATAEGRTDEALAALARVPDGDPMAAQAALMAGRLERARNRAAAAEAHLRRALGHDPRLIDAHKELIYLYGLQSRRREADAEFRALARLTPLTHHDLFTWALTHFTSWSPDVATDLQAFIDADPGDRHSRLALAEALLDQPGQAERVVRLLDALPATDPDALALRVGLAFHQGRLADAERLLRDGPRDHPGLARFRGRLAMLRKDPAAAAGHFRAALSAEPYDRVSTFELGQALRLTGREGEAASFLDRYRRLTELYNLVIRVRSPDRENQAPDLLRLGAACETAGLLDEARGWYLLAVGRDPLDTRAQKALYAINHQSDAGPPGRDAGHPR
jgi:tetratricopeptide (TPR) repeat protein